MNQVIDFSTLTWVKKELDQTLREARQALEAHVESPGDGAQLELLVGHLHQVYGTLQMVELYGASLLAEEMEYAARAIADKSVGHYDDACEVLMRAILQLPDYLERLIAGHRDIPLVLLPILNDLRAVRGENLLSENSMFSPDLDAPLPISLCGDAGDGNELQSQARHVRPSFQRGLLAWFRGYQPETSLGALSAVCESLQKCSRTTEAMRLWWVAAGVMDALRAGAIDSSAAVKRLIGQIDRQIKRVVDEGESALVQEPPVDLLKNLLFYVAQSRDSGPRVAEIQATYRLLDLLPGEQELAAARESLAGQNADLFATVAVAVKEELGRLKDALDLVLRGGSESAEKLQPLVDSLRSLGDTLGMLSLDAPRKAVISKAEDLSGCLDAGSPPPETALMDVASTLLFVESSVDNMGGSPAAGGAEEQPEEHLAKSEYNQVMDVVLQEAIADLVRAKDAIVAYTESSHDAAVLSDVPQWFSQVKGGLLLLGETRAAGLTGSVAKYVENELIKRADHPAQQELDSLADCICGLEYYLESRMEHRMYGGSAIGVAEVSIERLGYPANGRDQAELAVASEQADSGSGEQVAGHEQLSSGEMLEAASPDEETECSDAETVECGTFEADELTQPGEPALDALTISTDALNLLNATPDAEEQPIAAGRECDGGFYAVQQQSTSDYEMHGRDALGDAEAESQGQHPSVDGPEAESQDACEHEDDGLAVVGEDTDEEILEIFIEEAEEEFARIEETLPAWIRNPENSEALATVRRSFHTLKGSGRLIGAMRIGEFAWAFENMLNRLIDGTISVSDELLDVLQASVQTLGELVAQVKQGTRVTQPVAYLMRSAEALSKGQSMPAAGESATRTAAQADDEGDRHTQNENDALSTPAPECLDSAEADPAPVEDDVSDEVIGSSVMDPMLYEIFNTEAHGHLDTIRAFLDRVDSGDARPDEKLARALHTLHGSAHMAQADPIADISGELEKYAKILMGSNQPMPAAGCAVLRDSADLIAEMLARLPDQLTVPADYEEALHRIRDIREAVPAELEQIADAASEASTCCDEASAMPASETPESYSEGQIAEAHAPDEHGSPADPYAECDAELLGIFLEESEQNLETSDSALHRWRQSADDNQALAELQRALHTLKGGARMADLAEVGDLAHAVESLVIAIADQHAVPGGEAFDGVQAAQDRLVEMLDCVRERKPLAEQQGLIAKLETLRQGVLHQQVGGGQVEGEGDVPSAEPVVQDAFVSVSDPYSDTDAELLEVFLEEAGDILEHSEETLRAWRQEPAQKHLMAELQRELHTLKGGARMADITAIGDLAHAVESLMVKVTEGDISANQDMFVVLEQSHDRLAGMVEQVRRREEVAQAQDLLARLENLRAGDALHGDESVTSPAVELVSAAAAEQVAVHDDGEHRERRVKPRTSQELVRVKANLLDNMVNYAGEVSIYRSRLEQQVGAYRFNLVEMEQTVARLREQLRKLEIETEAQILFRYETESLNEDEDFDPLEMDRYSHMQQLSRSLIESVGDLASIQNLLENITRESETLLLQQSRVNTELQEGLMRTRMVPFLGLAARMRRIVRQTCSELGKKAELELSGAEGEMDRTVVDRIIAPIEHMLRNAISHGIETPDHRRGAGKPESGTIRITLERESSDILLKIADDGAGINLDAIRKKAVERGLMAADANLSDSEVLQFILETGFSTAEKVTQVAGRGVGMDVVNSEVKQLGGSLVIDSERGRGTTFTIRLPFTLALNQALLIEVGEDTYAVPLSSIEGIVRMRREDLKAYYADPEARFDYGGMAYEVRHLGSMLGTGKPRADSGPARAPVLLARTGDRCVAFQVENLLGSREIVVKSVGPQISSVRGITGATILGDGRVVMILDVAALLRAGAASAMVDVAEMLQQPRRAQGVTVMVVDDSITVRKVTTRLLERNDMSVVAAKDGVDAVSKLQEHIPDIMLLDIEMPRMDGFELATHVRNEPRLRNIPIIMITSRTGDKHRQRAMEIGVNRYLGKPFQEGDLLENIKALLEESGVDG